MDAPEVDYGDMVMSQMGARLDRYEAVLRDAALFLGELPQDLGRGSLNGRRVQLQQKIADTCALTEPN